MSHHSATSDTAKQSDAVHLCNSPNLVKPLGHYTHVAIHRGLVYVSGQLPVDRHGTPLTDQPFEVQARQVLDNLDHCLTAAGTDRSRLVSVTVYVTDIGQWPTFDTIYADWIGEHRPARAVAGASGLNYRSAVELHAVAALA